jgi:predicted ABC-type transport system involved in lysophospholipase L1 biosynthesis ATPase subunit
MVTHDPQTARRPERIIHLFDGRLAEEQVDIAVVN